MIARFVPIDELCIHRENSPARSADKCSRQQGANRATRCRHKAEKADNVCQDAGRDQKGTCDKIISPSTIVGPGICPAASFAPNLPQRRHTLASREYGADDSRCQNQEQRRSSSDPAAHFEQHYELHDRDDCEEQEQRRHSD